MSLGHGNFRSPLVHSFFRCWIRMDSYTHHCRAQHASMKHIARLKDLQNRAVLVLEGFSAIHGLMQVRVKRLAKWINPLCSELGDTVEKLLVDQFKTLPIILIFDFAVRCQGVFKSINHWNEPFDHTSSGALR